MNPTFKLQQISNLSQMQRLMMSWRMQQARSVLQMPVQELQIWVELQRIENPIIDDSNEREESEEEESEEEELDPEKSLVFSERDLSILQKIDQDFRDQNGDESRYRDKKEDEGDYTENRTSYKLSLFEHLMKQATESFEKPEQLKIAEQLIGNLNASGYLDSSFQELIFLTGYTEKQLKSVLEVIQTFEPYGVGATCVQECLLLQLKQLKNQNKDLALIIIQEHYADLLHNRLSVIQKRLNCSSNTLKEAIHQISLMDLHPGTSYSWHVVQNIVPDVTLIEYLDELKVSVNDDWMPPLRLNRKYLEMLADPSVEVDTKQFIKKQIASMKWMLKNISQRHTTLEKIALALARRQKKFFLEPQGPLLPLTLREVAEELKLHESTIARAISNKYLDSPQGLFPFHYFFNYAYVDKEGGHISSHFVRDLVKKMIENEDKKNPFSDARISEYLKQQGIACARRTIAKYRRELKLGNAQQRRIL